MNLFDFLLWAFMGVIAFRMVYLKRDIDQMIGWLMFGIIILVLQLMYEGLKWQSIGLYVMPVFWLVFYKKLYKKLMSLLIVTCFLLSSGLLVVFPTPILPAPRGPFVVGTTRMSLIDESRTMMAEKREIPIQVWYPAQSSEGKNPTNWMVDGKDAIRVFAEDYGVLSFMFDQLEEVKSHSYENVVPLAGNYPIVLLSHGWDSSRQLHINLSEHLASHGYMVIGIDHTLGAAFTKLHDGRIIKRDESLLGDDFITDGKVLIEMYKEDIAYVYSKIEKLNDKHDILKNHIDTDNIGLLAHSTGAGAAVAFAMEEPVEAIFLLDAWVEPIEITGTLQIPKLFFRSEDWAESTNNDNLSLVTDKVYQVKNAGHQDFTNGYNLSPVLELIGYVSDDSITMQEDYILAFFDLHLKGKEDILMELTDKYDKDIKYTTTK